MKIDLCKLFNIEEGEEFILETKDGWFNDLKYKIALIYLYGFHQAVFHLIDIYLY